jgi:hypothetical protein
MIKCWAVHQGKVTWDASSRPTRLCCADHAGSSKGGKRLAKEGVIGRFALDFVVVRSNGKWDPYAIEINLERGNDSSLSDSAISH